jgi:hypothetical protein
MQNIVMLQTADATHYLPMLQATERVNQAYCSRHNIAYSLYIGIKRGFFPWHACFNRIVIIKELIDAGHRGWVFYLDADAFVFGQSCDVRNDVIARFDKPLIIAPGGVSGALWDVNDGVFLVDLGDATARDLMLAWYGNFMTTPEEVLRLAPDPIHSAPGEWDTRVQSDQPRLQWLLQHNERYRNCVGMAERGALNSHIGSFVRQILRAHTDTFEERLAWIQRETAAVIADTVIAPDTDRTAA